ncbi:MAG: transporter ATP-binding protein [Anaerocolumna sp.]|nr:transporter ATP-binding protein [Anaerocolumna sp.]
MDDNSLNKEITSQGKPDKTSVLELFWKMMIYKPGLYLVNCILWAFIHVEPLILGLILKEFFQIITGNEKFQINIVHITLLTLAYTIGRMVNIYLGANIDNLHRFTMSALLLRNMFEAILKKPGAKSIPCSSGEALNCFRDDAQTIEDSISWTLDFIGNVVFVIVAITIMLNINVKITLFVFTPLVAIVGIVQLLRSKLQNYRKASREATGMVTGVMGEIFSSVQAIKIAGAEEHVISYLEKINNNRHKTVLKDTILTQTLLAIFYNTVSIGTGFILLLAADSMKSGNLSVGELSLFIYYLSFISDFTSFFGGFMANNRQAKISFTRIANLCQENSLKTAVKHNELYLTSRQKFKYDENTSNNNNKDLNSVEVKNLGYTYESSGNGIDNINFLLKKGSFTVITGRIGSGKSTLLKVLIGLLPVDKGNVLWNGKEVSEPKNFFISPNCAYTPQIPNLVSDTVKNNILFGLPAETTDLKEAIYSSVLEDDLNDLEKGLETVIGPKGVKLSGGQIQRVAAARMFARKAELMVFDDISSALDVETENKLWNRLLEKKNATCLVVSNRRGALKLADQIIVMKNGKIDAIGTLDELLENNLEIQAIWS